MSAKLRLTSADYDELHSHLFRPDRDEHGAIILAGRRGRSTFLARELHLLSEAEFPPGKHGYRQIAASALARLGTRAAAEKLALLTIHSHPGATDRNQLSTDDRDAHRRIFPHLLDIVDGQAVGGIALGHLSAAGEIWSPNRPPDELSSLDVVGHLQLRLAPKPRDGGRSDQRFDRQARMFGAAGQRLLREMTVAVVGVGGGGSMVVEQLAHLGVGEIIAVDYDVVQEHNLSRVVGSEPSDARKGRKKVSVARRLARRIDRGVAFESIDGDLADASVAERVSESDFIFLCTDTITSRLVANAIVHSHFVPMVQIGAKVDLQAGGGIESIYVAVRPVFPGRGCLACAGLIDPLALQREAASDEERANQNYLEMPEVIDPSVVTLNGVAASAATNTMLMTTVGLAEEEQLQHRLFDARTGSWLTLRTRQDPDCRWCGGGPKSTLGRGDDARLPVRRHTASGRDGSRRVRLKTLANRIIDGLGR